MIGDNIKRLMKANRYTQRELAMRAGITESALSRYIAGSREPQAKSLKNLAIALGVSVEALIADVAPNSGEGYVLCVDGVSGYFPKEFIIDTIRHYVNERTVLAEIREAYERYGGAYGMLQKINELEQRFGVIDCTKCRHFVGCESCRTGQVCGDFEIIEN